MLVDLTFGIIPFARLVSQQGQVFLPLRFISHHKRIDLQMAVACLYPMSIDRATTHHKKADTATIKPMAEVTLPST
jgi:hypothetical protein